MGFKLKIITSRYLLSSYWYKTTEFLTIGLLKLLTILFTATALVVTFQYRTNSDIAFRRVRIW